MSRSKGPNQIPFSVSDAHYGRDQLKGGEEGENESLQTRDDIHHVPGFVRGYHADRGCTHDEPLGGRPG